jgi:hypothetical protein
VDRSATDITIQSFLVEISTRLNQAIGISKAADACSAAGNMPKAIELALEIEPLVYEVDRILQAASLIQRIRQKT